MDCKILCLNCGKLSNALVRYKCSSCGGVLSAVEHKRFQRKGVRGENHSLWRYASVFPYVKEKDRTTLGEGWTPLVGFSRNVSFKLENLNPTGSFKDRGSSVLVSALRGSISRAGGYLSEDSSGNAGASIAAYAGRAGLQARIYVPATVSGPKLDQIRFYGSEVVKIAGSRDKVAEFAQKEERRKFYVGHILHPLFRDGLRSLAYEIAEQLGWSSPKRVYVPVSAGTLILGLIDGFNHLIESNVLRTMPKIVACQTTQVSPLYHRFKHLEYRPPEKITSVADALISINPPLLETIVKQLERAKGDSVLVEESEILGAFEELARGGFFVEPSSAVAYAAFLKQTRRREASKAEKTIIVLTGSGLKTTLKPVQQAFPTC